MFKPSLRAVSAFFILAAKLNGHKPKVQWLEALHRRATKIAEKTQSFIRDPAVELPGSRIIFIHNQLLKLVVYRHKTPLLAFGQFLGIRKVEPGFRASDVSLLCFLIFSTSTP